jgi:SAM-dependent methyltransferase
MSDETERELALEYNLRFEKLAAYRFRVWRELCRSFFQRMIPNHSTVLDVGCGWGEFINAIQAGKKYGMDLNPESIKHLNSDIIFLHQDCSTPWPLEDESLDVVFTSNFFEHLPSKQHLSLTVREARRCLKKGGLIICMGPNIRYLGGAYWNFYDHYLALSDFALEELMQMSGFREINKIGRFLPYTMAKGSNPPIALLRWYLRCPVLWRLFGRQFLVTARK